MMALMRLRGLRNCSYRLLDGAFGELAPKTCFCVRNADTVQDYGNEKEAGQGVKRAIDEGIVKREVAAAHTVAAMERA